MSHDYEERQIATLIHGRYLGLLRRKHDNERKKHADKC